MATLFDKLRVIVSQCERENSDSFFGWNKGQNQYTCVLKPQISVMEDAESPYVQNEQVELLRMLWEAQSTAEERNLFLKSVEEFYKRLAKARRQLLFFIAKFVSVERALDLLVANFKPSYDGNTSLLALLDLVVVDHRRLTEDDLNAIAKRTSELCMADKKLYIDPKKQPDVDYYDSVSRLIQIESCVRRVQYIRLRQELTSGVNYEINQDKDRLLQELSTLQFSQDLRGFLEHAEQQFQAADDQFSYKMCVDQIRSFFEQLLAETAQKVAAKRGDDLTRLKIDLKRPVDVRKYLLDSQFLSDQFRDMINGLYKFLSDEGTHTLTADKSVARVARNMILEVGLLVSRRTSIYVAQP